MPTPAEEEEARRLKELLFGTPTPSARATPTPEAVPSVVPKVAPRARPESTSIEGIMKALEIASRRESEMGPVPQGDMRQIAGQRYQAAPAVEAPRPQTVEVPMPRTGAPPLDLGWMPLGVGEALEQAYIDPVSRFIQPLERAAEQLIPLVGGREEGERFSLLSSRRREDTDMRDQGLNPKEVRDNPGKIFKIKGYLKGEGIKAFPDASFAKEGEDYFNQETGTTTASGKALLKVFQDRNIYQAEGATQALMDMPAELATGGAGMGGRSMEELSSQPMWQQILEGAGVIPTGTVGYGFSQIAKAMGPGTSRAARPLLSALKNIPDTAIGELSTVARPAIISAGAAGRAIPKALSAVSKSKTLRRINDLRSKSEKAQQKLAAAELNPATSKPAMDAVRTEAEVAAKNFADAKVYDPRIDTSRVKGTIGKDPIPTKEFRKMFKDDKSVSVLDYGAGPAARSVKALRSEGYDVVGYDLPVETIDPAAIGGKGRIKAMERSVSEGLIDKKALDRQYDVVIASDVLNVQQDVGQLRQVLGDLSRAVSSGGRVLASYPKMLRKMPDITEEVMELELGKFFGNVEVVPVGNTSMYVLSAPKGRGLISAAGRVADVASGLVALDPESWRAMPLARPAVSKMAGPPARTTVKDIGYKVRSRAQQPTIITDPDTDPLVQKMSQALKSAERLSKDAMENLARFRSRQLRKAAGTAHSISDPTLKHRGIGVLKGESAVDIEFKSINKMFTENEIYDLHARIWAENSPLSHSTFDQMTAGQALEGMLSEQGARIPRPSELGLLGRVFGQEFVSAVISKRKLSARATDVFLDVWNLPRAMMATLDLSASLRQGSVLGASHPRAWGKAFKSQLKAFASEEYAREAQGLRESHPRYAQYTTREAKLGESPVRLQLTKEFGELGEREEIFMSRLSGKLPGIKQSERAYREMLNHLRFTVMDDLVTLAERSGKVLTNEDLDGYASFINFATGRGPLMGMDKVAPILNGLFFSVRLNTSRFALPFMAFHASPAVRKQVIRDLVIYSGGVFSLLKIADASPWITVEDDARSSDFGKMKVGTSRFDMVASYLPVIRMIHSIISGEKKSVGTDKVYDQKIAETMVNFLRSKAHPSAGRVLDVFTEQDFSGREYTPTPDLLLALDIEKNPLLGSVVPLIIADVKEAVEAEGPMRAALVGGSALMGIGVTTFDTPKEAAKDMWPNKEWGELWPFQQSMASDIHNWTQHRSGDEVPLPTREAEVAVALRTRMMDKLADYDATPTMRDSDVRQEYYDARSELGHWYDGFRSGKYGEPVTDEGVQDITAGGSEAQKEALMEYWQFNKDFDSDTSEYGWEEGYEILLDRWEKADKKDEGDRVLYVKANTNQEILDGPQLGTGTTWDTGGGVLPTRAIEMFKGTSQYERWEESSEARHEYLLEISER